MAKKPFLIRIDDKVLEAVKRLAEADLRSVNAEVEYLLREAIKKRGVTPPAEEPESG